MPKIEIKQENYSINAEEVIERKVKDFGTGGAHIVMPKKYVGRTVLIVISDVGKKIGSWLKGYRKKYAKTKKVDFPKP